MRKNVHTGKEEAFGIQESCVNCYNRNHATQHGDRAFERLAKAERYRIFNRVSKETNLADMKRLGVQMYQRWALDERKRLQKEGFHGEDARSGPVQMLGAEGYWQVISEMRKNPLLRGPDGAAFDQGNIWCRQFVDQISKLNAELGEVKFQQLTDSMDFIRCLFGTPGQIGCMVVCYLCSGCLSCPKYDYHWCIVQGSKNWWSCCKCQQLYSPSDPTAYLFGIQVGPNPATDICWYVAHPPFAGDQDMMNLIKCITTLLTGRLVPEKLIEAANFGDLSAWAEEIVELLKADGCAFLGQVKDCGVAVDSLPLKPPKSRPPPSQFVDLEQKVEPLTVTQADIGAVVEFIDFTPVLTTRSIGRVNSWTNILCWIMSFFKAHDLLAMVKAMEMLPSPGGWKKGVGTKENRKKINNALWVAHFRETGLDRDTDKPPKGDALVWGLAQLKEQDEKRAELSGLVADAKARVKKGAN